MLLCSWKIVLQKFLRPQKEHYLISYLWMFLILFIIGLSTSSTTINTGLSYRKSKFREVLFFTHSYLSTGHHITTSDPSTSTAVPDTSGPTDFPRNILADSVLKPHLIKNKHEWLTLYSQLTITKILLNKWIYQVPSRQVITLSWISHYLSSHHRFRIPVAAHTLNVMSRHNSNPLF